MIDVSKLKYYRILCEKGIIDEQQNDLDDIMNTLEEKQFEYLKRLETTKDESRRTEINELLNTIDLQLKELAAIRTTLESGIIIESKDESASEIKEKTQIEETVADKGTKGRKKGKTGLILAVVAIVAVVAIAAVFMLNGKKADQSTAANDDTAVAEENNSSSDVIETADDSDGNIVKLGIQWSEGIGPEFPSGLYIINIRNQSLLDGGLQLGDRIITVNGEEVITGEECNAVISKYSPGNEATIVVDRDSTQETIKGVFIKASEQLPEKTSGEVSFELNGRPITITFLSANSLVADY